jgi:hypothetical protein
MSLIERPPAPTVREPLGFFQNTPFYTICYTGSPFQELNFPDEDYSTDRIRAITRNTKDGVKPMTKEEQDAERALSWRLIKQFTMGIFKMDVTCFSFPVGYNENRTFMERTTDLFAFLVCGFLERAYTLTSPEIRLSYVTIGIIASFHLCLQVKKPWNPVLGETYIGRWPNGAVMFAEQTCHHPPITCMQLSSPTNNWKIDARFRIDISQGLLKADIMQKGPITLKFADETVYEWEYPTIRAAGIVKGDRIVKIVGPLKVKDVANGLEGYVKIGPKASKSRGIVQPRATTIWGGVRRIPHEKDVFVTTIIGDYVGDVNLDGEPVWRIETDFAQRPVVKINDDELLLSDARFRIDRCMLILGEVEAADETKRLTETLQRQDAKLRISVAKPRE